jgi:uncharacterized membrane protein (DUF106 family)
MKEITRKIGEIKREKEEIKRRTKAMMSMNFYILLSFLLCICLELMFLKKYVQNHWFAKGLVKRNYYSMLRLLPHLVFVFWYALVLYNLLYVFDLFMNFVKENKLKIFHFWKSKRTNSSKVK